MDKRAAFLIAFTLAGCSQSIGRQANGIQPDGVVRIALPDRPVAAEQAPQQPEGAVWSPRAGGGLAFGAAGAKPLFVVSCTHESDGKAMVRIARFTRAEAGASAFLAIEGNMRVARVPVEVVRAGEPGEWQGSYPADDRRIDALKGGTMATATLPGGGALKLPANGSLGQLLEGCRASGKRDTAPTT